MTGITRTNITPLVCPDIDTHRTDLIGEEWGGKLDGSLKCWKLARSHTTNLLMVATNKILVWFIL